MQNVEQHTIKHEHEWFPYCEEITKVSRQLYNTAQFTQRQGFFYGWGTQSQAKLDVMFKSNSSYSMMPAKVAQLVFKQNADAWTAYFRAMEAYKLEPKKFTGCPKPPSYIESHLNIVKFNYQAISKKEFKNGYIVPSMSPIKLPVKPRLKFDDLCEVRIIPKTGCFVIEVVYDVPDNAEFFCSLNPELAASIDIGLDNLATIVFSDPTIQPIVINGKPLKSANQLYNKQLARFRGFLPDGRGTSSRIQNIVRNRNNFVNSYLHQSTKMIVDELVKNGVLIVAIGKNEQWKTSLNIGKRNNQNFTQIPHAIFIEMLTYKLEKVGITVKVGEESYTSKASLIDWDIIPTFNPNNKVKHTFSGKRTQRAWYVSKDGLRIQADVNGAFNIGRKVIPNSFNCLQEIVERDRGCLVVHPLAFNTFVLSSSR
ncbi:transposase [Scytonema hofmannii PCC 7110]|uniref:Transposase n=1 Tax=Scytonema hofmannii PCC 7110 TaxID=128403 RepID=A0A139X250_9CYAN|nr:RNA-guided endonuclease TnpB family protein [Scytonema hofmannii]KYC38702.1 transposase [Scytonema hofmannii PCC 7110]